MKESNPPASSKVTLDVGGRKFVTLASTLEESSFLRSMVSGRWDHDRQPDGSYFIDASPDLFEHVLEYLRRGCMPLFWDQDKGHDLTLYKALRQEADYYDIPRLERWLAEQKFLEAVTMSKKVISRTVRDNDEATFTGSRSAVRQHVKTEWVEELRYACVARDPRRLGFHGLSDPCGESCGDFCGKFCGGYCGDNCVESRGPSQDPPPEKCRVLKVSVVEEVVEFRPDVCGPQ